MLTFKRSISTIMQTWYTKYTSNLDHEDGHRFYQAGSFI